MTQPDIKLGDISKEMFERMDTDGKLGAIFEVVSAKLKKADRRIEKLENRKRLDTSLSGLMGLIGGALAAILERILKF